MNEQDVMKELTEIRARADVLEKLIKGKEIPKGTRGYASDGGDKYLRYFSHMEDGQYCCFYDGKSDGGTLGWKYFTPMDEAILGRLIPHYGGEYKGHPDDMVWPVFDGKMNKYAALAKEWSWPHYSGYYLIKKGGE